MLAARWQTGIFGTRNKGVLLAGFRNKNVKQSMWRPNHQPSVGLRGESS